MEKLKWRNCQLERQIVEMEEREIELRNELNMVEIKLRESTKAHQIMNCK